MERIQRSPLAERPAWKFTTLMTVIGLLLASYGACSKSAYADRLMMSEGWSIRITDDRGTIVRDATLTATEFIVDRPAIDTCNTNARMVKTLTGDVAGLRVELIEATKPEPGWKIGVKWAAWGITVGAAFILGVTL